MNVIACKSLKQASQVVRKSAELLGSSQKDGFGYAMQTTKGVFMERYQNPETCKGIGVLKDSRDTLPASIRTQLTYGIDYDQKGAKPENGKVLRSYIAHGRTATCGKSITNTHPFNGTSEKGEYTIAHNGVVDWEGEKYPTHTTCDSEHILNCFLYAEGEHSFKEGLSGYAAVVGINPNGDMFCLRDDRAPLYLVYIKQLGQYIICTDSTHCTELANLMLTFNGLKTATITTPMLLAPYVKHTFLANGEIESNEFSKFESYSRRIGYGAISRSLGSAGVAGYGTTSGSYGYGSYWEDQVDGYTATTNTPTSSPSTTPAQKPESEDIKELRKEQLRRYRANNKPWKHND
jgi:hypothetical protein